MEKKVALSVILSLALATTAMTALASSSTHQESSDQPVEASDTKEDGGITPFNVDKTWNAKAIGGANVPQYFSVNAGYGHLKLFMKNYSSNSVTVNLTHLDSTLVYFTKTIPAGGSLDWKDFDEGYPQGMRGGNYVLQWIGGSYNVNGETFGKLASSTSDF
ncbi:pilus assembly protein [Paenibacillus sp. F411]|uniref:pilus assembly protein n=1 Tax=Paenibacillus sp. F411 TaxID=2820239 RepID=UPI001AAF92B9|nr:pilus assembly protein [Paenibacillus sp. F411]MBO2943085.1 pilus assembly protein [Paenibacillus sp. F411]